MSLKDMRRLVIRAFHVKDARFAQKASFRNGILDIPEGMEAENELIKNTSVEIIRPDEHDRYVDTIMDIIPISVKALGRLGEGVTHTFTGIYVMLTGKDEDGRQMHEFGSSEGNLRDKMILGRRGTPGPDDLIIHINVILKGGQRYERQLPLVAFEFADKYISALREALRTLEAREADESHEYFDRIRNGALKVAIVKQIAGQGAMYDNMLFSKDPSGTGGISIIDMQCMPVVLSPNEYRDGAIRAMT